MVFVSSLLVTCFLLTTQIHGALCEGRKLVLAQLVFRHADRTPIYIYKSSPCPLRYYLDGMGTTTNVGLSHAYDFGKRLKERYFDQTQLLTGDYYKEIHVRSSGSERCIQTVQTLLAALYEPKGTRYEWSGEINWYPVPIQTRPLDLDELMRSESTNCPRLAELLNFRMSDESSKTFFEKHKRFFDEMNENVGEIINADSIWDIYQTQQIEFLDSKTDKPVCGHTPSWLTSESLDKFENITTEFLNMFYSPTPRNEDEKLYAKLLGGPLLKELSSNMDFNGSDPRRTKLYLYSGHDNTIYHTLAVLGIVWEEYIQFLTAIAFEIYELQSGEYVLEVYFHGKKNSDEPFVRIELPQCPQPCRLDTFKSAYRVVMSEDRQAECESVPKSESCLKPDL